MGGVRCARRVVDVRVLVQAVSWACLLVLVASLFAVPSGAFASGVDASQEDEDSLGDEAGHEERSSWLRVAFLVFVSPFLVGLGTATVYLVYRSVRYEL